MKDDRNDVYEKAADYLAEQGRRIFTGHMNGGLWNARCLDACILAMKKNDKVAYEFLLAYGNQYIQFQPEDNKQLWEDIKIHAAELVKYHKA